VREDADAVRFFALCHVHSRSARYPMLRIVSFEPLRERSTPSRRPWMAEDHARVPITYACLKFHRVPRSPTTVLFYCQLVVPGAGYWWGGMVPNPRPDHPYPRHHRNLSISAPAVEAAFRPCAMKKIFHCDPRHRFPYVHTLYCLNDTDTPER
jgi:hypothetical protein